MGLTVRKVQGGAQDRIRSLVAEHAQSLEPGLRVLETSLRLGRTTIDVVALDAKQTLVLVVAADVADERTLVSTLDAYVWCLAFPENVQRLCPAVSVGITRPPRVILVAERIPETFMELVERLSAVHVECQELHTPNSTAAPQPAERRPPVAPVVSAPVVAAAVTPARTPAPARYMERTPVTAGFDASVASQWESFLTADAAPAAATRNGHANGASNGHAQPAPRPSIAAAAAAAATPAEPAPAPNPATKSAAPAASAAKPATPEAPEAPEASAANHPALESLKFPKGGVSRQWQDFLDQLAAANT